MIGDVLYIAVKAGIIEDDLLTVDISVIGREGGVIIEDDKLIAGDTSKIGVKAVIGKEEIVAIERLVDV